MSKKRPARKPGPKEDRLKIEGDWREAVGKAVKKPRPKDWQEHNGRPEDRPTPSEQ